MAEYKTVRISDICEIVSGSTPKTAVSEYWEGSLKWITPAELDDEEMVVFDTARHISHQAVVDTHLNLLPAGTILFSSRAPIGKVAIAGSPMYCNQGFKNLICSNSVDNKYLYYYLKHNAEKIKMMGRGATFKEISKTQMGNLEIRLPNASVQVHRSKQLNCIDGVIRNKKAQLRKLDEMIRSRFIEMFGDPENNPMNWQVLTVGEAVVRGYLEKPLDGNHGEKHPKAEEYVKNGIPFIMANDLKDGTVDFKHCSFITENRAKKLDKGFAKDGDVLLTHKGTIGITAIMKKLPSKFAMLTPQVTYYRIYNGLTQEYLKCYFETDYFQKVLRMRSSGATRAYIGITKQLELPVMIPNIGNQASFSRFINSIDKSKLAIQKSIDELENLKKKLMQEYFG